MSNAVIDHHSRAPAAPDPLRVLDKARAIFAERGAAYGGVENNFDRAAQIATLMGAPALCGHDVATILLAVKLARLAHDPSHADSHIDAVNYVAFRAVLPPQPRR